MIKWPLMWRRTHMLDVLDRGITASLIEQWRHEGHKKTIKKLEAKIAELTERLTFH